MSNDPAKAKWMALQAIRWSGMAVFVIGMLIYAGKIPLPEIVGYLLMGLGLFGTLFVPSFLARRWKTRN